MQLTSPNKEGCVIITGGSRGIGKAIAELAVEHGYPVVINYANNDEAANQIVTKLKEQSGQAIIHKGDVSNEDTVIELFDWAKNNFGSITALINNAGIIGGFSRLEDLKADVLKSVVKINIEGPMLCAREAVRHMSSKNGGQGGSIINISSRAAVIGSAGEWIHYAMTKGAIDTMTIGLSKEVGEEGIRVNAVAPGLINTEIHASSGLPDRVEKLSKNVPLKRAGEASEVADAVLWLLSPAASYVTGAIVPVSGGR